MNPYDVIRPMPTDSALINSTNSFIFSLPGSNCCQLVLGCSGGYQHLETSPGNESNITHQELIDNWSDYNIFFHDESSAGLGAIIFDPKNDNRKIVVGKYWGTIKDQETWSEFVKAYPTSDGHFKMTGGVKTPTRSREATGVREILGPDNQLYGLMIHQKRRDWLWARQIDENTLKLAWRPVGGGGAP